MSKDFIKLNEVTTVKNKETSIPSTVGVAAIAKITPLKAGGSRISLSNGEKFQVVQSPDELERVIGVKNLYVEPEPEVIPAAVQEEEEAEVVDPADASAGASAAAIELADEHGIDIADVPPNAAGKIGKPEVEKFIKVLADAEEVDGGADQETE